MTFKDKGIYDGYWFDDKRNGYGTLSYNNGNYYKGEWKNDLFEGTGFFFILGKMIWFNGD
jgi:hypothetical protein